MKQKIFISSLISTMAPFRAAAKEAIEQVDGEAVIAEDFGAQAEQLVEDLRYPDLIGVSRLSDFGDGLNRWVIGRSQNL